MSAAKIQHPWYNYDKLMSFNAIFNIVAGGRGIGKTYGALKMCIKHAIERGEEFVYLRRYKPEIVNTRASFFTAVESEFPGHDLRVNGNTLEYAPIDTRDDKKREWFRLGYLAVLSSAQSYKGANFSNVTKIIFDEFIKERGQGSRYLPNELDTFINFFVTVDRYQDKTQAFMLANSVSIMNPYFIGWDIAPDKNKNGWVKKADNAVVAHFPDSADFKNSVYKTRFGKFIKDSEYARYSVENEFDDNTPTLIEQKDQDARYVFTVETDRGAFSVWVNFKNGDYYAQSRRPRGSEKILTISVDRMDKNKQFVSYKDTRLGALRASFNHGMMTFDHARTRNSFMEIFKR